MQSVFIESIIRTAIYTWHGCSLTTREKANLLSNVWLDSLYCLPRANIGKSNNAQISNVMTNEFDSLSCSWKKGNLSNHQSNFVTRDAELDLNWNSASSPLKIGMAIDFCRRLNYWLFCLPLQTSDAQEAIGKDNAFWPLLASDYPPPVIQYGSTSTWWMEWCNKALSWYDISTWWCMICSELKKKFQFLSHCKWNAEHGRKKIWPKKS